MIVDDKPIIPKTTVENESLISNHPTTVHVDTSKLSSQNLETYIVCEGLQEMRGLE